MSLKILIAILVVAAAALLLTLAPNQAAKAPPQPARPPASPEVARFWAVVDSTAKHAPNQRAQTAALRSALEKMTVPQIEEFDRVFARKMSESYRWDLWRAAYVINGGASDDGFEYFRRWLISNGRAFYEQALSDPDSLAETIPANAGEGEYEEYSQVAMEVWAARTGRDMSEMPLDTSGGSRPAG